MALSPASQACFGWIEDYILRHQTSPTYRQIQAGLGYSSLSSIQHHLKQLEKAGLIVRDAKQAKTIRLAAPKPVGIPICGAIAASSFVEVFPDQAIEYLEPKIFQTRAANPPYFALRVRGDSMIGAMIAPGDIVILEKPIDTEQIKDGLIVAARVEGKTTLKRWQCLGDRVLLKPENPHYSTIEIPLEQVVIEGIYRGLVRGIG